MVLLPTGSDKEEGLCVGSILVNLCIIVHYNVHENECSWMAMVKIRNTSEAVLSIVYTPLGHPTDNGPSGLGQ